jgi:ABC-type uncharacterized transport system ATPase subunit
MADMRRLLVDVAAGGQTVLLSSHLLAEVQEICHRVGVISEGRRRPPVRRSGHGDGPSIHVATGQAGPVRRTGSPRIRTGPR